MTSTNSRQDASLVLTAAVWSAFAPSTVSLLITGLPGSGKSHLIRECRALAHRPELPEGSACSVNSTSAAASCPPTDTHVEFVDVTPLDVFAARQRLSGKTRFSKIVECNIDAAVQRVIRRPTSVRKTSPGISGRRAAASPSSSVATSDKETDWSAPEGEDAVGAAPSTSTYEKRFVETVCFVLDRFDLFLSMTDAPHGDDDYNEVNSHAFGAGSAADGDGVDLGSSRLSFVEPSFVAEFHHWVHHAEGYIADQLSTALRRSAAPPATRIPPTAAEEIPTDRDCYARVRVVFVITTATVGRGGAGLNGGVAQLPPKMPRWLCAALFDWILPLPLPNELERREFLTHAFQHSWIVGASHCPHTTNVKDDTTPASDALASVENLAKTAASRTGGLTFCGMQEVVSHVSEVAKVLLPQALPQRKATESAWDVAVDRESAAGSASPSTPRLLLSIPEWCTTVCDDAVRRFYESNSQQALVAKERCGYVDVTKTHWADIAGLHEVKTTLRRLVTLPTTRKSWYARTGVSPCVGIVLYGPPGTGKTMLAKAIATELDASFIFLDLPQLIHAEVGEAEHVLRTFFETAKERSPCVLFIDEIQAAFCRRGGDGAPPSGGRGGAGSANSAHDARLVACFLALLDEAQRRSATHFTLFVGATNRIELIDPQLLLPGRLDTHIYIGNPDRDARVALIRNVVHGTWATWWLHTVGDDSQSSSSPCNSHAKVDGAVKSLVDTCTELSAGLSAAELRNALNVFALSLAAQVNDIGSSNDDGGLARRLGQTVVQCVPDAIVGNEEGQCGTSISDSVCAPLGSDQQRDLCSPARTWRAPCSIAMDAAFPRPPHRGGCGSS